MPETRYHKLIRVLAKLKEEKGALVTKEEFMRCIYINIGSNNQTLREVNALIKEFGMITEVEDGIRIN